MDFHELADLFPLIEFGTPAFIELATDVEKNGLRQPIITYQDLILDGRNRFRACEARNVEPRFEEWAPRYDGDTPLAYVISSNLHRRHLTDSQRQMIAAKLVTRQRGSVGGRNAGVSVGAAAAMLNVTKGMVGHARRVLKDAPAEEIAKIETGEKKMTVVLYEYSTDRGHKRKAAPAPEPEPIEEAPVADEIAQQAPVAEQLGSSGGVLETPPEAIEPKRKPRSHSAGVLGGGPILLMGESEEKPDAGPAHLVVEIRDIIDAIGSRSREIATISREAKVALCWDFARALQLTPGTSTLETRSALGSSLAGARSNG